MKTDVGGISGLSAPGVYRLLLHVSKEVILTIELPGNYAFLEGYYTYTGSAMQRVNEPQASNS